MRNFLAALLILVFIIVIVIPTMMVRGCTIHDSELKRPRGSVIKVFNNKENQVQDMDLEEYIKGVVAAEMPASFEIEALKAQAVVARTYVTRRIKYNKTISNDSKAVISTDFKIGQAWMSKEELQKKWGLFNYFIYWDKISRAVEETKGIVLVYHGDLIDALYHSNSGCQTEDAANVWGNPLPYLKSVSSIYDQDDPNYIQEINFSWAKLDQYLGTNLTKVFQNGCSLDKSVLIIGENGLLEILEMSSSGRVLQIRFDDCIFEGKDFREKLGLPSTKFELKVMDEGLKFVTYGKGHGVGMSQYGANGLAKEGKKYRDILCHYYSGIELGKLK